MVINKTNGIAIPKDLILSRYKSGTAIALVERPLTYVLSTETIGVVPFTRTVETKTYVDDITNAEIGDALRLVRDLLLAETDWIRSRHADEKLLGGATTLTEQQYLDYLGYVQALRDVPTQAGFPTSVVWPVSPVQQ